MKKRSVKSLPNRKGTIDNSCGCKKPMPKAITRKVRK